MGAPSKLKYRTANWKQYNAALKALGSLLIWRDQDMSWHGSASSHALNFFSFKYLEKYV